MLSVLGLRYACRRWLRSEPGLPALAGSAVISGLAGTAAAWLASAGTLPGEGWGPVVYGPLLAVGVSAVLMRGLR